MIQEEFAFTGLDENLYVNIMLAETDEEVSTFGGEAALMLCRPFENGDHEILQIFPISKFSYKSMMDLDKAILEAQEKSE